MTRTIVESSRAADPRLGDAEIDPRIHRRRVEVKRAAARRRLRAVLVAAIAVSLVAVGLLVLHSPWLGVRTVTVSAPGAPLAPSALVKAAGIRQREPLIDISPSSSAKRLEAIPWVGSATVRRSWPGRVRLRLTVRRAVAQVPVGSQPNGPVATVDGTGRVLARRSSPGSGLPLLEGVGAVPAPGSWLPTGGGDVAALAAAAGLAGGSPRAAVVQLSPAGTLTVQLVTGTVVHFGSATAVAAKLVALHLLAANGALTRAGSVNLSVPWRPAVTPAAGASLPGGQG